MDHPKSCSLRRMLHPRSGLAWTLATSIDERDGEAWDALVAQASPFLQRPYLRALERGLQPGEALRYAHFHEEGRLVGVACFQLTHFQGDPVGPRFESRPLVSLLARLLGFRGRLAFRVLVCGNPVASGEHGFHFVPDLEPERAMEALLRALAAVRSELERFHAIDGELVKDLPAGEHPFSKTLRGHFAELRLEPSMVLRLDPSWDSFDAYLECLASKYRVKAKRAYAKSQTLVVQDLDAGDLLAHQARVMALYGEVHAKAAYKLGELSFSTLLSLRRTLEQEFICRGYFHQGELVGFLTGFLRNAALEAHLVGFDHRLNHELSIYPRMLCDYLRLAIEGRCKQINFGRTATEIKSTLGAEPFDTVCYLRHRNCLPNHLTRILAPHLQMPQAPIRMPFSQEWLGMRMQQSMN